MLFNSIYLFFKNSFTTFSNHSYIYLFLNTLFLLSISSTVPYYSLEYISNLSPNNTINHISHSIYYTLYYIPSFLILFIIHNFKLSKLLATTFKIYNNPSHIYLSCLSIFIYLCFFLMSTITDKYFIFFYLANTLSYSIFLNEIAYTFLNNDLYNFNNRIDFYNNNSYIFIIYGFLISYLTSTIPPKLFLPFSFIITSLIQNSIINLKYNKPNTQKKYNFIWVFEFFFNPVSTFIGNIILYCLRKRQLK